jgi:hypothetical protein
VLSYLHAHVPWAVCNPTLDRKLALPPTALQFEHNPRQGFGFKKERGPSHIDFGMESEFWAQEVAVFVPKKFKLLEQHLNTERIIAELEAERNRLDMAIAALQRSGKTGRGRRRLSPAARKRISEGMKKKWAARKRAGKAA